MITPVLTHLFLEITGQSCWLCLRGRCQHAHHRFVGDGLLMVALAVITVHLVG